MFKASFAKTMEQTDDDYNLTLTTRTYYNLTDCVDEETAFPNSEITISKPPDTCFEITSVDDTEDDDSAYFILTCSDDVMTLKQYEDSECLEAFDDESSYAADAYTCEEDESTDDEYSTTYTRVHTSSCEGVLSDRLSSYSHSKDEEVEKFGKWRRDSGYLFPDQLKKTGLTPSKEAYQLAKAASPIVAKKLESAHSMKEIYTDLIKQFMSPYVWEFMLLTDQSDDTVEQVEKAFADKSTSERKDYLTNMVAETKNEDREGSFSKLMSKLNAIETRNDRAETPEVADEGSFDIVCAYAAGGVSFLFVSTSYTAAACLDATADATFEDYGWGFQLGTLIGVDVEGGIQYVDLWTDAPGVSYTFGVSATVISTTSVLVGVDVGIGLDVTYGLTSANVGMTDIIAWSEGLSVGVGIGLDVSASYTVGNAYCVSSSFDYDTCDDYTDECCGASDDGCFPGDATVVLRGGERVRMDQLSLGDEVMTTDENTGALSFAPVYLFGHKDPAGEASAILLTAADGRKIKATTGHYIPAAPRGVDTWGTHEMTRFGDIKQGMTIWTTVNGTIEPTEVIAVETSKALGLFNPFTRDGIIVVDDVVCSEYSEWFLDDVTPAAYRRFLPAIYHSIQAPLAWLTPYFPGLVGRLDAALSKGGPNFDVRAFIGSLLVTPAKI